MSRYIVTETTSSAATHYDQQGKFFLVIDTQSKQVQGNANRVSDISGLTSVPPPPQQGKRQQARVVLMRLTPSEFAALRTSSDPIVQRFYDAALAQGEISAADSDFIQARAYLHQQGIIADARWDALLA